MVRRSVFDQIFLEIRQIRYRLDDIERAFSGWNPSPLQISESELFSLPDHLRKTYVTVASKGQSSATEVSNATGRCRALESNYLNQLARMGWLTKRRDSRAIHFRLVSGKVFKDSTKKVGATIQSFCLKPRRSKIPSEGPHYHLNC
jgi:hypothetical protein